MENEEKVNCVVKHRWIWLAAITVVGFFIDIGTKHLAVTRLDERVAVNVVGEYLQWLLHYNTGAVFGLNPSVIAPWLPQNVFFIICMSAAILFLLFYFWRLPKNETLTHIGLMLVLPGALGNFYDRIFRGDQGVVDFIKMSIPQLNLHWFIYNVADIFVTVGVGVMIVGFIVDMKKANAKSRREESANCENTVLENRVDLEPVCDDVRGNNIDVIVGDDDNSAANIGVVDVIDVVENVESENAEEINIVKNNNDTNDISDINDENKNRETIV